MKDDGHLFVSANLYRGPQASHRYRDVFFPWPHLLFTDEVFEAFYLQFRGRPNRPAWVNKLTYSGYRHYFEILGFEVQREWFSCSPFDEDFYSRFEDVLSRYPRTDLERDFLHAILVRTPSFENDGAAESREMRRSAESKTGIPEEYNSLTNIERELQAAKEQVRRVERQLREERNRVRSMRDNVRWKAGTLLVDSARRPWRLARLPFDLLRLAADRRHGKNESRRAVG